MNVKPFLASLVAAFILMTGTVMAQEKYINGIDANYPPFAYLDEKGNPAGFDVESMNWIAKKMGFTVEHKAMDWAGIVPSLLAKKIDMVCSGMSISPERKARVTFSTPYWSIRKYLLVQKGSTLTKEELLKGNKNLGVQGGTNEATLLTDRKGKDGWNYTLKLYADPPLAIQDLVNGRIDGAAIDSAPADEAINKGKKPIKVVGEFADPDEFGVAMRNEDKALHEKINKGYALLKQDPFWEELQAKYLRPKK